MLHLTDFMNRHFTGTFFFLLYILRDKKCQEQNYFLELFSFISNNDLGSFHVADDTPAIPKLGFPS